MKLHIGGEQVKEGWMILNAQNKPGVDFVGDISDLSQFADESIDEVYASHVLEHVPQGKVLGTIKGVHRVLKSGGAFYISVPDMDILAHTFINPIASLEVKFHVMKMMFGGQIDAYDYHFFGWNQQFLTEFLVQAGFNEVKRVQSHGLFQDTSDYQPYGFTVSLNAVAYK